MNHSESIAQIAAALAKAQGAMSAAKMDSTNPFLKNKYADLGSVIQAGRSPLAVNGLSFTQHPALSDHDLTVTTLLMHSSGEWIESSITLPFEKGNGISLAQSMGAVITYLRRYTLSAVLGIYADEDTDGNENKQEKRQSPAPQNAPQAQKQAVPSVLTTETSHDEPQAEKAPETPNGMTLAEALAVTTSDKEPKLYSAIDSGTLSHMATAIQGKLFKHGYPTAEAVGTAECKLAAIKLILADRAANPAPVQAEL
jgi:hypothetical protein